MSKKSTKPYLNIRTLEQLQRENPAGRYKVGVALCGHCTGGRHRERLPLKLLQDEN